MGEEEDKMYAQLQNHIRFHHGITQWTYWKDAEKNIRKNAKI